MEERFHTAYKLSAKYLKKKCFQNLKGCKNVEFSKKSKLKRHSGYHNNFSVSSAIIESGGQRTGDIIFTPVMTKFPAIDKTLAVLV